VVTACGATSCCHIFLAVIIKAIAYRTVILGWTISSIAVAVPKKFPVRIKPTCLSEKYVTRLLGTGETFFVCNDF
jgi:hypothetical protein